MLSISASLCHRISPAVQDNEAVVVVLEYLDLVAV